MKNAKPVYYSFKVTNGLIQTQVTDISHFLLEDSKIQMHFKNGGEITVWGTMRDIESLLGEYGFIRIHQNCILNLNQKINYCEKGRIIKIADNCVLTVAKDRIKKVRTGIISNCYDKNS